MTETKQVSALTKNIKVSDELAERLASHGGFHTSYAQLIEALLNTFEKHYPDKRVAEFVKREKK